MALLSDVFLGLEQLLWTLPSTEYSVCLDDYFAIAQIVVYALMGNIRTNFCDTDCTNKAELGEPFYWLMKSLKREKSKNIVFHSFGWWTSGNDSWKHPISLYVIWKEGWTDRRRRLFLFRGKVRRGEAEAQAFSVLPLFFVTVLLTVSNRCSQELSLALVKSCGSSCVLICGSAIAK